MEVLAFDTLGNSRMTWVYRIGGRVPLAVGKAYATADPRNPDHVLIPFRWLPAGRYELQFGRYATSYPVTMRPLDSHEDSRAMLVKGHLPL